MTALSKAWVAIADSAVDPDSPLDTTLITGLRDDLIHLREWLGASYFAGARQDHSHDGVDSALIQIGPNLLRNGSFESDTSSWTFTDYGGGAHAISAILSRDGAKSAQISSTVLANGGGDATSNEFVSVSETYPVWVKAWIGASVANVSSKVEVLWYDINKALLSASTIAVYTNTPTVLTRSSNSVVAPVNARFFRVKLTGGVPASGTATGTVTFDGVEAGAARGQTQLIGPTNFPAGSVVVITGIPSHHSALVLTINNVKSNTANRALVVQVSVDNGASFDTNSADYRGHTIRGSTIDQNGTASLFAADALANIGDSHTSITVIHGYNGGGSPSDGLYPKSVTSGISPAAQFSASMSYFGNAGGINALALLWNASGNFTGGTYSLYGVN